MKILLILAKNKEQNLNFFCSVLFHRKTRVNNLKYFMNDCRKIFVHVCCTYIQTTVKVYKVYVVESTFIQVVEQQQQLFVKENSTKDTFLDFKILFWHNLNKLSLHYKIVSAIVLTYHFVSGKMKYFQFGIW